MRRVKSTRRFQRDFKKLRRSEHASHIDDTLLTALKLLSADAVLPERYADHQMKGDYQDCRDCHLRGDLVPDLSEDRPGCSGVGSNRVTCIVGTVIVPIPKNPAQFRKLREGESIQSAASHLPHRPKHLADNMCVLRPDHVIDVLRVGRFQPQRRFPPFVPVDLDPLDHQAASVP